MQNEEQLCIFSVYCDGDVETLTENSFVWSPFQKTQYIFAQLPATGGSGGLHLHRELSV